MPAMTADQLKARLEALAGVGDSAAIATLEQMEYWRNREQSLLRELKHFQAEFKRQQDAQPTVTPAEMFQHWVEVAAHDKTAKEFYAGIVRTLVDLANYTRSKTNQIPMPWPDDDCHTELCIHWYDYVQGYGEKNRRIEYLEEFVRRNWDGKPAPETPAHWNPGYSPRSDADPETVAAAATMVANAMSGNPEGFTTTNHDRVPHVSERIPNSPRKEDG